MIEHLRRAGIPFRIYNQYDYDDPSNHIHATNRSRRWFLHWLRRKSSDLSHFHHSGLRFYAYYYVYSHANRGRWMLTIHNERLLAEGRLRQAQLRLLRGCRYERLLVVSDKVYQYLVANDIPRVEYLPAYVPDLTARHQPARSAGRRVLVASIWRVEGDRSISLYGLDLFFRLAVEMGERCEARLYVGMERDLDVLYRHMEAAGARSVISVFVGEKLVEHLPDCDLFLRPTREDGYGVSLQEAMDCGSIAIASDVCERPAGTQLFANGDYASLHGVVLDVLSWDAEQIEEVLGRARPPTYHLRLIEIYEELLKDQGSC